MFNSNGLHGWMLLIAMIATANKCVFSIVVGILKWTIGMKVGEGMIIRIQNISYIFSNAILVDFICNCL
jgi:hypothetical protein